MYYITYNFNGLICEATLPTLACVEALEASGAVLLSSRWME